MPAKVLHQILRRGAFGRLLRQVVLDDLIIAARAADGLAQLEILLHGQLLVAGDEDVVCRLEIFLERLEVLLLVRLLFHF